MTLQVPARNSLATDVVGTSFRRFVCAHCGKVLKVRAGVSGEGGVRGKCPQCGIEVEFSRRDQDKKSGMAQAILRRVGVTETGFSIEQFARLSLLLSQGTCRDYALAAELLGERELPAKRWRLVLREAVVRERMRRRMEECVPGDSGLEGAFSWCDEFEASEGAWQVMARFLHHQRQGDCGRCRENPTGLACVYLEFESFMEKCDIAEKRAGRWRELVMEMIGV